MNAHYFQHVSFEGLGSIQSWLETTGYKITKTQFFNSCKLPEPDTVDLLIVMGGPMSVNEEDKFPWLIKEKQFIFDFINSGKPVLGICLGAQLIANAMGAKVYKNFEKEIGWFPIHCVPSTNSIHFKFPHSKEVFHWHGETFDLPSGAIHLARSAVCENQAFQLGRSVMGLQFHLETTPETAREIVKNCRNELIPSKYIQGESEILEITIGKYKTINKLMDKVLSFIVNA
jgi:GMP synthase-like glutamine amidotransferase